MRARPIHACHAHSLSHQDEGASEGGRRRVIHPSQPTEMKIRKGPRKGQFRAKPMNKARYSKLLTQSRNSRFESPALLPLLHFHCRLPFRILLWQPKSGRTSISPIEVVGGGRTGESEGGSWATTKAKDGDETQEEERRGELAICENMHSPLDRPTNQLQSVDQFIQKTRSGTFD